jgi:hypothetical protein
MRGLPTHGYMPTTVSANQEVHAIRKRVSVGDGVVGEAELVQPGCTNELPPAQGFGRLDYQRALPDAAKVYSRESTVCRRSCQGARANQRHCT